MRWSRWSGERNVGPRRQRVHRGQDRFGRAAVVADGVLAEREHDPASGRSRGGHDRLGVLERDQVEGRQRAARGRCASATRTSMSTTVIAHRPGPNDDVRRAAPRGRPGRRRRPRGRGRRPPTGRRRRAASAPGGAAASGSRSRPRARPATRASPAPVGLPTRTAAGRASQTPVAVAATTPSSPSEATTVAPRGPGQSPGRAHGIVVTGDRGELVGVGLDHGRRRPRVPRAATGRGCRPARAGRGGARPTPARPGRRPVRRRGTLPPMTSTSAPSRPVSTAVDEGGPAVERGGLDEGGGAGDVALHHRDGTARGRDRWGPAGPRVPRRRGRAAAGRPSHRRPAPPAGSARRGGAAPGRR